MQLVSCSPLTLGGKAKALIFDRHVYVFQRHNRHNTLEGEKKGGEERGEEWRKERWKAGEKEGKREKEEKREEKDNLYLFIMPRTVSCCEPKSCSI